MGKRIWATVLSVFLLCTLFNFAGFDCRALSAGNYSVKGTWMDSANWEEVTPVQDAKGITYKIENERQFAYVMNLLYANKNNGAYTTYIELTGDDIDLSGKEWMPGGYDKEIEINGVIQFQGRNRIINGMQIGSPENPVSMKQVGLFPMLKSYTTSSTYYYGTYISTSMGGRIYNLGLTNASVYASQAEYAGILLGTGHGLCSQCFVQGTISVQDGTYVGGIAGFACSDIEQGYFIGTVENTTGICGGMVGDLDYDTNIDACYCSAAVSGEKAGAFVGKHESGDTCISNCYYDVTKCPDIPTIYDATDALMEKMEEEADIPHLTAKTTEEMKKTDFLDEIAKYTYNPDAYTMLAGEKHYQQPKHYFIQDTYFANNGFPMVYNEDLARYSDDVYKQYPNVTLPSPDDVANEIVIFANPATRIYYTTDGTTPTINSAVYTGPISLAGPMTLNILAVRVGCARQSEQSESYTPAVIFSDTENHWAKNEIAYVVKRGLFSGTSPGYFSPESPMTRGMFATVLGRLSKMNPSSYSTEKFSDVSQNDWYYRYVAWACENQIMVGVNDTQFMPERPITREEIAVILQKYAEYSKIDLSANASDVVAFADEDSIDPSAMDAVNAMRCAGIITGKTGNRFAPEDNASRAEISVIFKRFLSWIDAV